MYCKKQIIKVITEGMFWKSVHLHEFLPYVANRCANITGTTNAPPAQIKAFIEDRAYRITSILNYDVSNRKSGVRL